MNEKETSPMELTTAALINEIGRPQCRYHQSPFASPPSDEAARGQKLLEDE